MPAREGEVTSVTETDVPVEVAGRRFAQNMVAEAITIVTAVVCGLAGSSLIVRGLPKAPIYEFYVYVVVFAWVGLLLPLCLFGVDVALTRHLPELVGRGPIGRVVGWSLALTMVANLAVLAGWWFAFTLLPAGLVVPVEVVPYLQLALVTLPLTALSTAIQGAYRGFQEMRFCAYAMAIYHGLYLAGLAVLYLLNALTLIRVIILNICVSLATIAFELPVLVKLIHRYRPPAPQESSQLVPFSFNIMAGTAVQVLLLTLLAAIFLNIPLLIANEYRTSEILLAGLGLATSVATYVQRGQAAPFRALMPRVAGDAAQGELPLVEGYVNRAVKLGSLFNAFGAIIVALFAAPALSLIFGWEGMVAAPLLALMAGGFVIYPLASTLMDTLIGLGRLREVLLIYAGWTATLIMVLVFLCPLMREVAVALGWLVGLPFLFVFLRRYRRGADVKLEGRLLPKGVLALGCTAIIAGVLLLGMGGLASMVGSPSVVFAVQLASVLSIPMLFFLYLWMLVALRVLGEGDLAALAGVSQVLHPLTLPATKLIRWLEREAAEK